MIKEKFKKNATLTGIEYKKLSQEKLIELFIPLINRLGRAYGEKRFDEDVKQACTMELLIRQEKFDETNGLPFAYYAHMYLKAVAKRTRQMLISAIYVPYSSMVYLRNNDKLSEKAVVSLDESKENSQSETFNNEALIHHDEEYVDTIQSYTLLKIILKKLNASKYSEFKKNNIKKYIREFLKTGKINKVYNNILRLLLDDTCLKHYFSSK